MQIESRGLSLMEGFQLPASFPYWAIIWNIYVSLWPHLTTLWIKEKCYCIHFGLPRLQCNGHQHSRHVIICVRKDCSLVPFRCMNVVFEFIYLIILAFRRELVWITGTRASLHYAVGYLTTGSPEVWKPSDSGFDFFNPSTIWQASRPGLSNSRATQSL